MKILIVLKIGCGTMTNTRTDPASRAHTLFVALSGLVFAVSASATIFFCRSMSGGMPMPGGWTMSMMWMRMPGQTWAASAAMFMLMWLAMMVAMMLPSALLMLLNFRRSLIGNRHENAGAPVIVLASGYFLVWSLIGAVVYPLGVAFALATMHLEWLSRMVPVLSGAALIAAGAIQFTPWKLSGLRRCRDPMGCAASQNCDALREGWHCGLKQGVSCFVCCAAPMLALLVLGATNLAVMVVVAAFIAVEKLLPKPDPVVRILGVALAIPGTVMVVKLF